jgi:CYTH domain-containing protein
MTTEIERKFVVAAVPAPDVLGPGEQLRQGYLAEEGPVEVRVRIGTSGAVLTVKAGRGLRRTEVEVPVGPAEAEALWAHTEGRRIEKVRHRVDVGGATADVDVYGGALEGLCTAEVEFASEAEAAAFTPPAWWDGEVTGHDGWANAALARHGRPPAPAG